MIFKKKWGFFCVILVLVSACTFSPDGDFFNELEEPIASDIDVSLENLTTVNLVDVGDTLTFFEPIKLRFGTLLQGREVVSGSLRIANRLVKSAPFPEQGFDLDINPKTYGTGYFSMILNFRIKTNSGSLAEKEEGEFIDIERKWILEIDIDQPQQIHISSVKNENGFVTVRWPKYERTNFQKYTLIRFYQGNSILNGLNESARWEFDNADEISFIDSGFVAGRVQYRVNITAANQERVGPKTEVFESVPNGEFKIEALENGKHRVEWNKPLLEKAFTKYRILERNRNTGNQWEVIREISDINETSFEYDSNLGFGDQARLGVETVGSSENPASYVNLGDSRVGAPIPEFVDFESSAALNAGFFLIKEDEQNGRLVKLDLLNNIREDSLQLSDILDFSVLSDLIITPDGNRLFVANSAKLYEFDPATLNLVKTHEVGEWLPPTDNVISLVSVSNNGVMNTYRNGTIYLVDLSNGNVLFQLESDERVHELSPNGDFLVTDFNVYKRSGNSFLHQFQKAGPRPRSVGFLLGGSEYFINTSNGGNEIFSIVDINTGETLRQSSFDANELTFALRDGVRFDGISNAYYTYIGRRNEYIVYFSLEKEELNRYVDSPIKFVSEGYFSAGDYIFSRSGLYLKFK